jgi:hypothetical protein
LHISTCLSMLFFFFFCAYFRPCFSSFLFAHFHLPFQCYFYVMLRSFRIKKGGNNLGLKSKVWLCIDVLCSCFILLGAPNSIRAIAAVSFFWCSTTFVFFLVRLIPCPMNEQCTFS